MGFGVLFLGYAVSFLASLTLIGEAMRMTGYCIMMYATIKLLEYNKKFLYAFYSLIPLVAVGIGNAILWILCFDGTNALLSDVKVYVDLIEIALIAVFHTTVAVAIFDIADDTDLPMIKSKVTVAVVTFVAYFLTYSIAKIPAINGSEALPYFNLVIILLQLAWVLFFLISIFYCYRYICDEVDARIEEIEDAKEIEKAEKKAKELKAAREARRAAKMARKRGRR